MAWIKFNPMTEKDLYPFVETVSSAIVEVACWQMIGYSLIIPMVFEIKG
jgi:intracellular sulfur oxidation DsrE/DsrF family protein